MAKEISNRTGCPNRDVIFILNSLGGVVKDKFSDLNDHVELKIFPGLKVTSKYIPLEQSKSNLNLQDNDTILRLSATFSDDFRRKVRASHNKL